MQDSASETETGEARSEAKQEEEARQELEARMQEMRDQLAARDRRIEQLERLVHARKENAATQVICSARTARAVCGEWFVISNDCGWQGGLAGRPPCRTSPLHCTTALQTGRRVVRPGGRVSPAKSLHNLTGGPNTGQPRPCQHSWGPCANDHSYHHSRYLGCSNIYLDQWRGEDGCLT